MARRCLIVDDHPSFRSCARLVLESDDLHVVAEAANGEEALEVAAALRPDVVVLDVQLPDMTGFDVCEEIRRRAAGTEPPVVVFISSRDGSDYGDLVERSGGRGFIPKDELTRERVAELLDE